MQAPTLHCQCHFAAFGKALALPISDGGDLVWHMRFDVTILDCPAVSQADCVPIGTASGEALVNVPPRQARNFTASLYYGSGESKLKGRLDWRYKLTSISASRH